MLLNHPVVGHSAAVKIELFMAGQRFPVAQIARDTMYFDEPTQLPSSLGELVLTIDGHPRRWSVIIRNNTTPSRAIEADFVDL